MEWANRTWVDDGIVSPGGGRVQAILLEVLPFFWGTELGAVLLPNITLPYSMLVLLGKCCCTCFRPASSCEEVWIFHYRSHRYQAIHCSLHTCGWPRVRYHITLPNDISPEVPFQRIKYLAYEVLAKPCQLAMPCVPNIKSRPVSYSFHFDGF